MIAIRKVALSDHHQTSGRTKHTLIDSKGARPFPPITSLVVAQSQLPGDSGYYLMHFCADGSGTDTWHETLEDAFHQAEWEVGVERSQWTEVNEPFR